MSTEPSDPPDPPKPRRRLLLKGAAAATVVVAGGLVWRANQRGVFGESQAPFTAWELWRDPAHKETPFALISAGILASNPHNTQAWAFRIWGNQIEIFVDTRRHLGSFDPYLREAYIGLGCLIENMVLAAAQNGFSVTVEPERGSLLDITSRTDLVRAATMTLIPPESAPVPNPLYEAIPRRHTNRYAYERQKTFSATTLDELRKAAEHPALSLFLYGEGDLRRRFDTAVVAATTEIVADKQMIEDSHAWFRDGPEELARERSGLSLDAAGLPPWLLTVAKMLPALPAEQSHGQWLNATRDVQLPSASLVGLIAVRDRYDRPTALLVGRAWQRMHLTATHLGIAMQPINQPVETVDRERQLGREPKSEARLAEITGAAEWKPTFAFRAGHPTREAPRSARRVPRELMIPT